MGLPTIQCFAAPCIQPNEMPAPIIASSAYDTRSLMQLPPVLSYAQLSPSAAVALPNDTPIFSTSTNELDRYRVLFLILGIIIGAMFLSR